MNTVLRTADRMLISLTSDERIGLANALNEVCNGVHFSDAEFRTRLGVTRESMLVLLVAINSQPVVAHRAPELADAWAESGAVMVRAITAFGDPVEMGDREVRTFAERLQSAIREAS